MSCKRALPSKGCAALNGMCSQEGRSPHRNPIRSWLQTALHLHLNHCWVSALTDFIRFTLLPSCPRAMIAFADTGRGPAGREAERHRSGSADTREQPPEGDASLALASPSGAELPSRALARCGITELRSPRESRQNLGQLGPSPGLEAAAPEPAQQLRSEGRVPRNRDSSHLLAEPCGTKERSLPQHRLPQHTLHLAEPAGSLQLTQGALSAALGSGRLWH